MSLKAGGVGLNLTAASNVFLMVQFLHHLTFNLVWKLVALGSFCVHDNIFVNDTGPMVESCC